MNEALKPTSENLQDLWNTYAWGKSARVITEPHFLQASQNTEGNIVGVDLGSSFPLLAQIMRGQHERRCWEATLRAEGRLIDGMHRYKKKPASKIPQEFAPVVNILGHTELLRNLERHRGFPRTLIRAVLFDTIYDPPLPDSEKPEDEKETLRRHLSKELSSSRKYYQLVVEPEGSYSGQPGSWDYRQANELYTNLSGLVGVALGKDGAKDFLEDLAVFFTQQLAGKLRRASFLSLDIRDLAEIADSAIMNFPNRMSNSLFFRGAIGIGKPYIRSDVRKLPFVREGVSFYSSIECWPFYSDSFTQNEQFAIADAICESLKPGGRAVFFPWLMSKTAEQNPQMLEKIVERWREAGFGIEQVDYAYVERKLASEGNNGKDADEDEKKLFLVNIGTGKEQGISDRELVLIKKSPVFRRPRNDYPALVIIKPKLT